MSWGYKIALAYGSFVIMMLYFIFVASRQTNELVEEHYYEKELAFQNVLNANENLTLLHVKPNIQIENKDLRIEIPEKVSSDISKGKIEFIRLSDKSKDVVTDFTLDQSRSFKISGDKFQAGIYNMKISWMSRGVPYNYDEPFNYPKP